MIEIIPNLYLGGASQMINSLATVEKNDLIINCSKDIIYDTVAQLIRIEVEDDCSKKAMDIMSQSFPNTIKQMGEVIGRGNNVYVHCKMGQQRSCAIIAAFLMKENKLSLDEAVYFVKTKKKDAFFWQINFKQALERWEKYVN